MHHNKSSRATAFLIILLIAGTVYLGGYDYGMAWDEPVQINSSIMVIKWFESLNKDWIGALSKDSIDQYWYYNHEHPPITKYCGALFLKIFGQSLGWLESIRLGTVGWYIILLISTFLLAEKVFNPFAGLVSLLFITLMPRVFGHGHFAEHDMPVASMWILLSYVYLLSRSFYNMRFFIPLVWGLAMGTKIQGVLAILPVVVHGLIYDRKKFIKGICPLLLFGPIIFYLTWPWLWWQPLERIMEFVEFFTIKKRAGAWYYMPLMSLVTVPVPIILLSISGLIKAASDKNYGYRLIKINIIVLLVLFTLFFRKTYDGVRLFLFFFPFLAIAGYAGGVILSQFINRLISINWLTKEKIRMGVFIFALIFSSYGLIHYHPYHLSYYNLFVGGLRGAKKLGLEITYWGEAINREVLDFVNLNLPRGASIALAPLNTAVIKYYIKWGYLRKDFNIGMEAIDYGIILNRKWRDFQNIEHIDGVKLIKKFGLNSISLVNIYHFSDKARLLFLPTGPDTPFRQIKK